MAQWEEYRFARLTDPEAGASICLEAYQEELEQRLGDAELSARDRQILEQLLDYGDSLLT